MPLHKSSRAHRLDPTMISAPLGDFRHTMHIGRGGDAFGDTSFLSTVNQSPTTSEKGGSGTLPAAGPELAGNHSDLLADAPESPQLQRSESVSSLTMDLDLDLDLGPSILGDVLGVMDGLSLGSNGEAVLSPKGDAPVLETKHVMGNAEMPVNGNGLDEDSRIPDENGWKSRGLKPKVRFSDKREEIIRQPSEDEEGQAFELHGDEEELGGHSPATDDSGWRKSPAGEAELTNHKADVPPSPASSHSSESDMVTELDRRRSESGHSETDSEDEEEEEEEEEGRGYSFEDESDDEIGL